MKKYRWEQDQIANMKEYIARFGHGSAKLARQAQSKEKTLDKMVRDGLTEKVETDRVVHLNFENVGKLPPPVLQFSEVTFGYSRDRVLYQNVSPCHTDPSIKFTCRGHGAAVHRLTGKSSGGASDYVDHCLENLVQSNLRSTTDRLRLV